MNDFSAFADLMKQFIELFDTLIPIEQDKLDATVKNRVAIVEDFMHKEQAAVRIRCQTRLQKLTAGFLIDSAHYATPSRLSWLSSSAGFFGDSFAAAFF